MGKCQTQDKLSYWVLQFLEYRYNWQEKPMFFNYEESSVEPIEEIQKKLSDDKKDRLIWNLLCNGTSEYTDYENVANRMKGEVLSLQDDSKQKEAFNKLLNDLYYGDAGKSGNTTIVKIGGHPFFTELFRAFYTVDTNSSDWLRLIDFYFRYENITHIESELIEALNYCRLDNKNVYIDILKRFNALECLGNLHHHKIGMKFLSRYIGAIYKLGYSYSHVFDTLRRGDNYSDEHLQQVLQMALEEVDEIDSTGLQAVAADAFVIRAFIVKNLEIARYNNTLRVSEPRLTMDFKSLQSEEFGRLMVYPRDDTEAFNAELNKSFAEGKISVKEIYMIRNTDTHPKE